MKPQIEEKKAALVACYDLKSYFRQVTDCTGFYKSEDPLDLHSIAVDSLKAQEDFIDETIEFLTLFISEINPENLNVRQMIQKAAQDLSFPG